MAGVLWLKLFFSESIFEISRSPIEGDKDDDTRHDHTRRPLPTQPLATHTHTHNGKTRRPRRPDGQVDCRRRPGKPQSSGRSGSRFQGYQVHGLLQGTFWSSPRSFVALSLLWLSSLRSIPGGAVFAPRSQMFSLRSNIANTNI